MPYRPISSAFLTAPQFPTASDGILTVCTLTYSPFIEGIILQRGHLEQATRTVLVNTDCNSLLVEAKRPKINLQSQEGGKFRNSAASSAGTPLSLR